MIGNPLAFLAVYGALAHDPMVVSIILVVLAATFFVIRRIILQNQRMASFIYISRAIWLVQFPLLLTILYLRWEKWTGQSPWQMRGYDLILPAVGFFIFAFGIIHWLVIRNR
jgi:hypothetical protein